ncbi:MAG TPA: class I SAM-dependent methyltransferase [Actinomycetota bacterium]|nr:class I SAM-dependent methyltransferase [Actinomycetota bacterium]
MNEALRAAARAARGFLPSDEGLALYEAALGAPPGPLLEVGSYCGKSAIYLGAAARERGTVLYSIDHHRGSEEHQPGQEYHDDSLVDEAGRVDTFPVFRRTIEDAGLGDVVIPVVAASGVVAKGWATPLSLVFVDGGHSQAAADADLHGWGPHVARGGLLAIHDVFEDPAEGGRPPYEIYRRAIDSGAFAEVSRTGSLRVLERTGVG